MNLWGYLVISSAVVLGFSKELRNKILKNVTTIFENINTGAKEITRFVKDKIFSQFSNPFSGYKKIAPDLKNVLVGIDVFFEHTTTSIDSYINGVVKQQEPEPGKQPLMMIGAFIQLIFLMVFCLADIIQSVNTLSLLHPGDIAWIPQFFQNLSVSVLASSIGIALATSFIIADLHDVTKFGNWHRLPDEKKKTIEIVALSSFIFSLILEIVMVFARICASPEAQILLNSKTVQILNLFSVVASNLIFLPLLVTTFLFWHGILGFVVVFIILIWLADLIVRLSHLLVKFTVIFLTYSLNTIFNLTIQLVLLIVSSLLLFTSWVVVAICFSMDHLIELLQSIIDLVYVPVDSLVGRIYKAVVKVV